jgi:hypothetical protein
MVRSRHAAVACQRGLELHDCSHVQQCLHYRNADDWLNRWPVALLHVNNWVLVHGTLTHWLHLDPLCARLCRCAAYNSAAIPKPERTQSTSIRRTPRRKPLTTVPKRRIILDIFHLWATESVQTWRNSKWKSGCLRVVDIGAPLGSQIVSYFRVAVLSDLEVQRELSVVKKRLELLESLLWAPSSASHGLIRSSHRSWQEFCL